MEIRRLVLGPIQTNTYIVKLPGKPVLIIDPAWKDKELETTVRENCAVVFVTHGHFDHIAGLSFLREVGSIAAIHNEDADCLTDPEKNLSAGIGMAVETKPAEILLKDGDFLMDYPFQVLHTPGHSRGSSCLYSAEEKTLFCGDVIFENSYGRTDLSGGDRKVLAESIQKLIKLPDDTTVYPGHGEIFKLGDFKKIAKYILEELAHG